MQLISKSGLVVLISLTVCGCQTTPMKLPAGVSPVSATWLNGRYTIPGNYLAGGRTMTYEQEVDQPAWTTLAGADIKPAQQVPVVLYMHGCTGWSRQDEFCRELLTGEGYAIFMPNSFAHPGRRRCNQQGTLAKRETRRTQEVEFALQRLRPIEWVGKARAILVGYSEGGNTTGNWSQPGSAAHMSMASACTSVGDKPAAPRTSTPAPETSWRFLHKGQHHSAGCVPCRHETERQTSDNSIDGGEYDPHQRGLVHRLRQVVAPAVPGR